MRTKSLFVAFFLCTLVINAKEVMPNAQQKAVEKALQAKFTDVHYHPEGGGWYLLTTSNKEGIYYAMGDRYGNVVASDAVEYKVYDGYLSLRLADASQKLLYKKWQEDMQVYIVDYQKYNQVNVEYEKLLNEYNARVEVAKQKATEKYKQEVAAAQRKAQEEHQRNASNYNSGGLLGGVLNAIGSAVVHVSATSNVNYDAILAQILDESNLLTPPNKPYNPEPEKPQEPDLGYYWKAFTFQQPCPYDSIDYDRITTSNGYADVRRKGKYGLVNAQLKEIIPCISNSSIYQGRLADDNLLIAIDGKYGVLDTKTEKILLSCEYEDVTSAYGYFLCKQNNYWGVYTAQAQEVYPCQYQNARLVQLGESLGLSIQEKGLWGMVDFHSGEELLPCRFESIEVMSGEVAYIKTKTNNQVGLYTAKGVLLFPCEYTDVRLTTLPDFDHKTLFELIKDNTIGLCDSEGVEIIPSGKYSLYRYKQPFFYVSINQLWGICTDKGEELVACRYASLSLSSNLFIATLPDGTSGLINFNGQELFPFVAMDIVDLSPDYITVRDQNNKFGAMNYQGEMIVPIKNKRESVAGKVAMYAKKNNLKEENSLVLERTINSYNAFAYRHYQTIKKRNTFSFYAQNYVERIINDWQKKGEFEKVADWHKRVNGETRKQKVFVLTKEAQEAYVQKCVRNLSADTATIVGNYDPDNETYRVRTHYREEDLIVPVPAEHAMEFKTMFASLKKEPIFYVEDDSIALAEYKFYLSEDNVFSFNNEASLTYNIAQVDYNFDEISINPLAPAISSKGKQIISTSNIAIGNSDVDLQIPVTSKKQENTFVVIIANKNYDEAPNVEYAFNDGYMFKEYCMKTLGIPQGNIRFKEDATFNNIREAVNWIREIANNKLYKDNAKFIFYYSGHGVPDEMTRGMYLLPKDGVAMNIANTGYKISDLYDVLAETSAESLVLLDACFSGFDKSGSALASTKGVVKISSGAPKGNTVVFSASSSNEVAHQYEEKSHGLFTYYLLKKLQESKGEISLGDLFQYVEKQVVRTSLTVIRKSQTPTAAAGANAAMWKERRL